MVMCALNQTATQADFYILRSVISQPSATSDLRDYAIAWLCHMLSRGNSTAGLTPEKLASTNTETCLAESVAAHVDYFETICGKDAVSAVPNLNNK